MKIDWDFIKLYYWQETVDRKWVRGITKQHYPYECTKDPLCGDATAHAYWNHHGYTREAPLVRYVGEE